MDLFAWKLLDMPNIDSNVVCHQLALDPTVKMIAQRKRKVVEYEFGKLTMTDFIKEIRYPTWLANIVMVKKKSGK